MKLYVCVVHMYKYWDMKLYVYFIYIIITLHMADSLEEGQTPSIGARQLSNATETQPHLPKKPTQDRLQF